MHVQTIEQGLRSYAYDIQIGSGLLNKAGFFARKCLGKSVERLVVVSDRTVFELYGEQTENSLRSLGFAVSNFVIKPGEANKSLKTAASALDHFSKIGLRRTDAVVALGGGVVGDLAGFAAAIYLRGVPFVQIPTTLVAMIDASVGGKTGVNSTAGKNLTGAFHSPAGVLIDTATLDTLPRRELTAGFCEAIKHGAIGGKALLKQTAALLGGHPIAQKRGFASNADLHAHLEDLIAAHVGFKAKIVAGDPLEDPKRTDRRSRKILNFGHTLAHALEKVTDYRYFRHGEAVGYGILFAAELSKILALCGQNDVKLLNDVVHRVGALPPLTHIDANEIVGAFRFDKKNLSGSLQMVLLKGIGKPVIITGDSIPRSAVSTALDLVIKRF